MFHASLQVNQASVVCGDVLAVCNGLRARALYIFVLLKGYGEVQTDVAGIVTALTASLTVVAIILAAGLWLHKRAPQWVKRLRQYEAQRRTQHKTAKRDALDYVRENIRQDEGGQDDKTSRK